MEELWGSIPSPSRLYATVRQLPLCLRVRHSVSIVLVPVDRMLVLPSSSSLVGAAAGRRNDSTWPPDRPTVRIGSVGCRAWAKRSDDSGRVHRFSNMIARLGLNKVVHTLSHDDVEGVIALGFDVGGRLISGGGSIVKVWQEKMHLDDSEEEDDSDAEEVPEKRKAASDSDDSENDSSDEDDGQRRKRKRKRSRGKEKKNAGNGILGFKGL